MRDPLQTEPTPYEILGVERGAEAAVVDRAFMAALAKRVPPNKAKAARDALQNPARRARYDLLEYDPSVLSGLSPSPVEDPSVLSPRQRTATAEAWEQHLRHRFPDVGTTHALALLWYWWALHEEGRLEALLDALGDRAGEAGAPGSRRDLLRQVQTAEGGSCDPEHGDDCPNEACRWRDDCLSAVPPLEQLWVKAIGCWSLLATAPDFWQQLDGLSADQATELKDGLVETLRNHLVEKGRAHAASAARGGVAPGEGAAPGAEPQSAAGEAHQALAGVYRDLEVAFTAELRAGRAMADAGVRTANGKVACGATLLRDLGLLDEIRAQVQASLARSPKNQRLRHLVELLSDHAEVVVLLDQRRAEAALERLDLLPETARGSAEALDLRARALRIFGAQRAELGELLPALKAWGQALGVVKSPEVAEELRGAVVALCEAQVLSLPRQRRDDAIEALGAAAELVDQEKIRNTLAELLTQRGIDAFTAAQKEAKTPGAGVTPEIVAAYRRALEDLERAEALGYGRARENAEAARGILRECEADVLDVPPEIQRLIHEATEAQNQGDPERAIRSLRSAVAKLAPAVPDALEKKLSKALSNRAVELANEAIAEFDRAGQEAEKRLLAFIAGVRSNPFGLGTNCSVCGTGLFGNYYRATLPGKGAVLLCVPCHSKLQQLINAKPKPSKEVIRRLHQAYGYLTEALALDPASEHAKSNLGRLTETLKQHDALPRPKKAKPSPKAEPVRAKDPGAVPAASRGSALAVLSVLVNIPGVAAFAYLHDAGYPHAGAPGAWLAAALCAIGLGFAARRRLKQTQGSKALRLLAGLGVAWGVLGFMAVGEQGFRLEPAKEEILRTLGQHLPGVLAAIQGEGGAGHADSPGTRSAPAKASFDDPTYRYEVRPGDSLSAIARRHQMELDEVLEWNQLTRASVIHPGQKLVVRASER